MWHKELDVRGTYTSGPETFARAIDRLSALNGGDALGYDRPANQVVDTCSLARRLLRDEVPTHVAVAFDKSRQTFRLEEYPEYKAKRNKTPEEFSSQLPLIEAVLDTFDLELASGDLIPIEQRSLSEVAEPYGVRLAPAEAGARAPAAPGATPPTRPSASCP